MHSFEFINFEPGADLANLLNMTLLRLIDYIPNGLIVAASLTKSKDEFHCEIVVRTRDTDFIQDNVSGDATAAVESATDALRAQMIDWRVKNMKMTEESFWSFERLDNERRHGKSQNGRKNYGSEKIH